MDSVVIISRYIGKYLSEGLGWRYFIDGNTDRGEYFIMEVDSDVYYGGYEYGNNMLRSGEMVKGNEIIDGGYYQSFISTTGMGDSRIKREDGWAVVVLDVPNYRSVVTNKVVSGVYGGVKSAIEHLLER